MTRAARFLSLLLPLLSAGASARADLLYVLNSGDANVQVIDARTREEVNRIPVLREAHHLILTPDQRTLLVADSGGNEMLLIDPQTGQLQRRERVSNPYHLAFSPDARHLVVLSLRRDQVDIYDANMQLLARLRMPDKPSHLAFSPDSRIAYVTLQGSRAVAAISLETRQHLWTAEVGREPAGILWHRGRLIVGVMGTDHFAVLNPETRQVERTIPVGRGAHNLFLSPDGSTIWAMSRVESRIAQVDAETLEVRRVFDIPGGPDDITFDPEGRIYATLRWSARVAVLDPRSGDVQTFRVGRSPHGILYQVRRPTS